MMTISRGVYEILYHKDVIYDCNRCYGKGGDCDRCGGSGKLQPCLKDECKEHGCSGYGYCFVPKSPS